MAAVAELDFRKRSGMVFTLGDGERVGWLGLNTASRGGAVEEPLINPVVGVRYRAVEEWVARGKGEKARVALSLAGRRDDALAAAAQVRASLGIREDFAAEGLRRFLDQFQAEVKAAG